MGCKFSISIVHPLKKTPEKQLKKKLSNPDDIDVKIDDSSDNDSYTTLYIDTPPDSSRKRV